MSRLIVILAKFFLIIVILIISCASSKPILPSGIIDKVKENLGYALAPTYLPDGFEYSGPFIDNHILDRAFTGQDMTQSYSKVVSMEETAAMAMIYPVIDTTPASFRELVDLVPPENAISEIEINDKIAYLSHGSWSEETLKRVTNLEIPINPEWDYDGGISIRFAIDVPDYGRVWVSLRTVMPTDEVNDKDLIRIAKSIVVIK